MTYPHIDPILLHLGHLELRWYGLMYAISFYILASVMHRESRTGFLPLSSKDIEKLFLYLVVCILGGARIFYMIFYSTESLMEHPFELFALWHGGLSFHGGFFGVALASYLISRKAKIPWLSIIDTLALCGPIGFGLGRIGNFINGELFGRVSNVPWAMIFPNGGPLPRHPSQLYESFLEGLVLGILVWTVKKYAKKHGIVAGTCMLGYAAARIFVEFFREPDVQLGFILGPFTMGQLLSLSVVAMGVGVIYFSNKYGAPIVKAKKSN